MTARLRAFATERSEPGITVDLELTSDGVRRIPPPRGPRRRLFEPDYALDYFTEADVLRFEEPGVLLQCDPETSAIRVVLSDPSDDRASFLGSHLFFTLSLLELLKRRGRFAMHAGGVARDGRGILFAGPSGTGKTTLAVACVLGGFDLLGDDVVLLKDADGDLVVRAFPDEIDLPADARTFFGELASLLADVPTSVSGKRSIHPLDLPQARIVWEASPAALVFPHVSGSRTHTLRRISADEALPLLVPNVVRTEMRATQQHLDVLARLVRTTPAFQLEIADPREAPGAVASLLSS